jgi:putative transposase
VQYVNRTYRRSGTLWEGRFRSCPVGEEDYLLGCQRYIELNPVRAGMVEHPGEYRWSSYGHNAQGSVNALIRPHPPYTGLGLNAQERREAYRELFRYELDLGLVDQIRTATNGGFVLGTERFQREIAAALGRRTWRGSPGRPLKSDVESRQQELEV